jgi:archaellum component FlaC
MAETDFDRLTRVMLGEFNRVHGRLDDHDDRFDAIDRRFDRMDEELRAIRGEIKSIRSDLDDLTERVGNVIGYRKEIDHALTRIAAIEKHLGIR